MELLIAEHRESRATMSIPQKRKKRLFEPLYRPVPPPPYSGAPQTLLKLAAPLSFVPLIAS